MKKVFCLIFLTGILVAGGNKGRVSENDQDVVSIHFLVNKGPIADYDISVANEFNGSQDRIHVDMVEGPGSVTDLYAIYIQMFEAQQDTIDLFPIDPNWAGDFAEHLADLRPLGADKMASQMFEELVNSSVLDDRLLALPTVNTSGLMLYRKDLIQKYGYSAPPRTWDELEQMASTIQQGERATNPSFWGYVWQGDAYEGLVCDLLEWTYSNGNDVWVNKDRIITINNPSNVAIIERAKSWIGTITPPGVLAFKEEESRAVFQAGNAAFMRNWFYAYGLANADDSPIKDLVGIAPVPAGDAGHGASTIGAWAVGLNRYSKHPQETFEFLEFFEL